MASKNIVDGIASLLTRDSHRGIDVTMDDDEIVIDVYVIIEHGVRIRAVAESIQHTTRFHVEKILGLNLFRISIFGFRISN